jgi:hypothetical protein
VTVTALFCAQCLSTDGPFEKLPHGKDDALVWVCERCQHEHPRMGRYNFSEATRTIPRLHGHHTRTRRS